MKTLFGVSARATGFEAKEGMREEPWVILTTDVPGLSASVSLSPDEARELAAELTCAANLAEGGEGGKV